MCFVKVINIIRNSLKKFERMKKFFQRPAQGVGNTDPHSNLYWKEGLIQVQNVTSVRRFPQ